jgi:hypothetical protein
VEVFVFVIIFNRTKVEILDDEKNEKKKRGERELNRLVDRVCWV